MQRHDTAVDKAETEQELSRLLNADSVEVIAKESQN
jgi:dTDP-4-dehydrorhamnose reductase